MVRGHVDNSTPDRARGRRLSVRCACATGSMSATGTTGTGELESVRSAARARPTGDPAGRGCELTRSRPRAGQLHRQQTNPGSSAGTHDTVANDAVANDVIGYDVIGYDVIGYDVIGYDMIGWNGARDPLRVRADKRSLRADTRCGTTSAAARRADHGADCNRAGPNQPERARRGPRQRAQYAHQHPDGPPPIDTGHRRRSIRSNTGRRGPAKGATYRAAPALVPGVDAGRGRSLPHTAHPGPEIRCRHSLRYGSSAIPATTPRPVPCPAAPGGKSASERRNAPDRSPGHPHKKG